MAETIKLNYITKIEGHADLAIKIKEGKVERVNLKIFEGARFFEGLVTNMEVERVPLVTSRICGICSQAHLLASYTAIEKAYNLRVSEQTKILRKLLLYASIMQSHVLHLFFMSLPDYYRMESAIALAEKKPGLIKLALKIKQLANRILIVVGGREIHSVTTTIGGFNKLPTKKEIEDLKKELKKEFKIITEQFRKTFTKLEKINYETKSDFLALSGREYSPFSEMLRSSSGKEFIITDYKKYLNERIKKYSTAKFVKVEKKNVITGALARINMNHKLLNNNAKKLLKDMKLELPNKNPFNNNLCQAVEIIHLYEECMKLLKTLKIKEEKPKKIKINKESSGISALEVPRGTLFHEYKINKKGIVTDCNIITPTTQNIQSIENDIKSFLPIILDKSKQEITMFIERLIRSYDPCISCSTHFLKIRWE
jgi:coenzyme F420-reducing hydrogenase alpha subunit